MKVAVIGLGGMGRHHARVLQKIDLVTEVIGCDPVAEMRAAAEKEGIRQMVASVDAVLASRPDAALVVTPPAAHAACIRPCLEAGIPVLTEKPLTTDLATGRELVELAARKKVNFQVGFELRYCGMTRGMQAILAEGQVGEPLNLLLVQISGHHAHRNYMTRARCGGIFYEKLCHQVDYFRFMFGEPVRIMAAQGAQALAHYGVADNVMSCLQFPGGRAGHITFITTRAAQVGGTDDHGDRGHFYEFILTCTKGSITYDAWTEKLEVVRFNHRDDLKSELVASIPVRERWGEPSYDLVTQNRDFLDKVRQGQPATFPAADALKSMEWVAKAEESLAAGGKWVE